MLRLAASLNIPDQKQKMDDLKEKQLDLVTDEMRSIRGTISATLDYRRYIFRNNTEYIPWITKAKYPYFHYQ